MEYDDSKKSLLWLAQQGLHSKVSPTLDVHSVALGLDGEPRDTTLRCPYTPLLSFLAFSSDTLALTHHTFNRVQLFFNDEHLPHFIIVCLLRWQRRPKSRTPFKAEIEYIDEETPIPD